MSTTHLNLYVVRNAKGLNSFETLCSTMFGSKKGKFNQKVQLTHLREMSIYMSAVTSMEEAIFSAITLYLKDLGDSDADRKLFRTAMYLLSEAIAEYSSRNELTKKRGAVLVLNSLLGKELGQKGGSSKQFLIWRTMGSIVHAHNAQAKQLDAIRAQSESSAAASLPARNTEIETFVTTRLHSTFEGLQYPVQKKKSVLFGEDKEFFPKMLLWSSVMSALARCEEGLQRKGWANLSCGLTCTHYTPLVQHSFRVLWNTAKGIKDDDTLLSFMTTLLADRDGSKGKEQLNVADVLCCTYLIRTLSALARNCTDLQRVDPTSQENPCSETLRTLMNLFIRSLRFLQANNVKIVTEMASALLDKDDGSKIICMITQITSQQKMARSARPKVIAMVTEALISHMQAVGSIEAVNLPPLLRACETLGRFLVHRPYFSPRQQQKDGDTIASLWTTLRRLYRSCLAPKDDCTGSDAQLAGRALTWRQQRAQAGSSGGGANCAGYNGRNCWSWPAENPSVATAAISHGPHILCALLRAQIWMAPDQRYCPKEHALLWGAFSESLLSSWQLIITTLSGTFDILTTLMPLLTQYFARVQASTLVGPPAKPAVKTGTGNFLDFSSDVPSGSAEVAEIAVYYQPVYVDVLIALTEQLVTATRSGIALNFLQSVWKWLATLTSARAHKQQAAAQTKKDQAAQAANATFPVSDVPKATAALHEAHADQAFLQSIARMTVLAQQYQLHTASVPTIMGTSSPEETAKLMHNLYSTGLWHLADNAMLCFSLKLDTTNDTESAVVGEDVAFSCTFTSHAAALQTVVKILSEAATQGEQPNVRNIAILGLVKVSCQLLLSAEEGDTAKVDQEATLSLLQNIFREFALIYLNNFGYTLDLAYRNALSQLLSGEVVTPAGTTDADFVVELMSHVFALPSTIDSTRGVSALPSIFTILQSAMKMLCAQLQSRSCKVAEQFRTFVTVHASLQRNKFVLLVLPPPAAEPEEEVEEEEEVVAETEAPAGDFPVEAGHTQTAGHTTASSDNFMGFDDDLLGGWANAPVLAPSKAARVTPVAAAPSGGLLDMGDMWLLDMPLEPTKPSATAATAQASSASSNVFDIFGDEPLFPAAVETKVASTPAPFLAPPPAKKRTSYVRNIYDDDAAAFTASTATTTAATAAPLGFANDAFAPTAATDAFAPTAPASAFPATSATSAQSGFGDISQAAGFDWPGASSAPVPSADPFGSTFFASSTPSAAPAPAPAPAIAAPPDRRASKSKPGPDAWPAASTGSTGFEVPTHANDGFAATVTSGTFATAPAALFATANAATVLQPAAAMFSASTTVDNSWAGTIAAPPAAAIAPPMLGDDFDSLPGFGTATTTTTTPTKLSEPTGVGRRASQAPPAAPKENVVSSEVAAAAAARRANRRASTGAGKAAAADPFGAVAGVLTPTNKVIEAPVADVWGSSVPLATATASTAAFGDAFATSSDPFGAAPAPAAVAQQSNAWPAASLAVPSTGFAATDVFATSGSPGSGASSGFQATPSDFAPSTPNSAYANTGGYPPSYAAPYDPAAAGAYNANYAYPYPPPAAGYPAYPNGSYGTAPYPDPNYQQTGYPPAPIYGQAPAPYAAPTAYPNNAYPNYAQPAYGAPPAYGGQAAAPPGGYDPAYGNYAYPPAPGPPGAPSAGYYAPYNQPAPGQVPGAPGAYPPQSYPYHPPS